MQLAAISFITLFAEVAFIRWLSAETRIFGFYKNFALISCFLGLGAGATLGKKSTSGRWFVPALAAFALLVMLAAPRFAFLRQGSGDEFLWMPLAVTWMDTLRFYVALVLLFALNTGVFYAGGQAVGEAFERLPPLPGYAANLGGSFLGVAAFTLVSYLQLGPFWWFAIACATGIVVMWHHRATRWPSIAMTAVTLVFLGLYADPALWSPYYKITLQPYRAPDGAPWGVRIRTNATYHQLAIDLSEKFAQAHPGVKESIPWAHYNLPYRFVKPQRVLVLGAGAGNDVAAALRNGATAVAAVEIDPVIASLGRRLHPEKPYEAPEVKVVVDDARNFLTKADGSYDLIVYGLLDSHTVVAAMSNVRLDSFMYTRESFARARELLAPDGMLALSFSSGFGESWWLLRRIAYMLERAFGTPPVILDVGYDGGFVFLAGPQAPRELTDPVDRARAESAQRQFERDVGGAAREEVTDDWPFMYLRGRWIPVEYWIISAVVLVLALAMVWRLVPGGLGAVDGHFFCLGAGFLLVEVRNLAELSLLFGSTWVVNAFVIAGVLVMAFAANVVAGRVRVPVNAAFIALALAVALSFFSPVKYLAGTDPWVRMIVGTGILSLPFFFSGLIFSTSFKVVASPAVAYGSNLLGAVAGGLLEHGSLSHGIRSLSLLALVIYALAFLLLQRRKAQEAGARSGRGVSAGSRQ